jgi:hypothetical protein
LYFLFTTKKMGMKTITVSLMAVILLTAFSNLNKNNALKAGPDFSAWLTGANEIPGPGDADGSGTFHMTLNQGQGTITYELTADGIIPATAAHIHIGNSTVAGPVLIGLTPPTDGSSSGVITGVDPEIIKALRKNPENYYVNVHNADHPAGAIRGQLQKH